MSTDGATVAPQYEIVTESSGSEAPLRAIKHGETFAVFDQHGDIEGSPGSEQGVYHDGTRFLSQFEIGLSGKRPLLLSSSVSDDNTTFTVDLTNPDIARDGVVIVPRGEIHFFRCIVLYDGRCHQRLRISNYGSESLSISITVRFANDFVDVFEVRGIRRTERGRFFPPVTTDEGTVLRYVGLDRLERRTRIRWDRPPDIIENNLATFVVAVNPRSTTTFEVAVGCEIGPDTQPAALYDTALAARKAEILAWREATCRVTSGSESFNRWIARSESDLQMMITRTPHGLYPYAGIPWFSTPFGRDGLLTAMELLWAQPDL